MSYRLICADVIDGLARLPDQSVDAIVTDPPYELGFMNKAWDSTGIAFKVETWKQCLRVLKPGGHLLAFSGSRTYHRMAVAIEDAGFQIRDQIMWIYGSGFPKSLDVSKAIDKAAGDEREAIGPNPHTRPSHHTDASTWRKMEGRTASPQSSLMLTAPTTEPAKQWEGWGTALKPAHEPIVLARKPLCGTVAQNVLEHGTGAINIDGCRVATNEVLQGSTVRNDMRGGRFAAGHKPNLGDIPEFRQSQLGRFPANIILDEDAGVLLDEQSGITKSTGGPSGRLGGNGIYGDYEHNRRANEGDPGNNHPTVKPTDLIRYLVTLITPPGGTVLDPFMGSGTTGIVSTCGGWNFIGIDSNPEYVALSRTRIYHSAPLFAVEELEEPAA